MHRSNVSDFPVITHEMPLEHTRFRAAMTMLEIRQIVTDKKIDPANLVILDAQHHYQMPNVFFAPWLASELQRRDRQTVFCEERSCERQDKMQPAEKPDHENFMSLLRKSYYSRNYHVAAYIAAMQGVPYRAVDIASAGRPPGQNDWDTNPLYTVFRRPYISITGDLPEDLVKRGNESPFFKSIFTAYPEILGPNDGLEAVSKAGMVKRNLFMMDRISTIQKESGGPIVMGTGKSHVMDTGFAGNVTTLLQLLTETGKDIIQINHGVTGKWPYGRADDRAMFEETHTAMLSRMPSRRRDHYHACFVLKSPGYTDWKDDSIANFMKMQLI